jgi:hypothetical protein
LTCANSSCCPPGGTPFDASTSAVAAAATYDGIVVLPDRGSLVAELTPVRDADIDIAVARADGRLTELGRGSRGRRAAARVAVRDALDRHAAGGRLDDDELAWLAVLVAEPRARDDAWQRMLASEPRDEHLALWRDVVRRVPERYVPAPATLLALAAWRAGDGARAGIAADRALAAQPGYALAGLVLQALQAALPPSVLEAASVDDAASGRRASRVTTPR